MAGCRGCFVAGVLAGLGLLLVAGGVVGLQASKRLARGNLTSFNVSEVYGLVERVRGLVGWVNSSGFLTQYSRLVGELPRLERGVESYGRIYEFVRGYWGLISGFYNLTHSRDYNETLRELEAVAASNDTIVGMLFGDVARVLAGFMREAQNFSTAILEAGRLILSHPPSELRGYLELAKELARVFPPSEANRTLAEAARVLASAEEALKELNQTGGTTGLREPSRVRLYSTLALATGLILAATGVAAGFRLCSSKHRR